MSGHGHIKGDPMPHFDDQQDITIRPPSQEKMLTGASAGLVTCQICETLCHFHANNVHCPVCGAHLHVRNANSFSKSVAYLIAAYILYIEFIACDAHRDNLWTGRRHHHEWCRFVVCNWFMAIGITGFFCQCDGAIAEVIVDEFFVVHQLARSDVTRVTTNATISYR